MSRLASGTVRALALSMALATMSPGQRLDPAKWAMSIEPKAAAPGAKILAHVTATIEPGWHLYSLSTPPPSPPTKLRLAENAVTGPSTSYHQEPQRTFDNNFNIVAQTYETT